MSYPTHFWVRYLCCRIQNHCYRTQKKFGGDFQIDQKKSTSNPKKVNFWSERITVFKILRSILKKIQNHQYRKKWTSKTGLESTFYRIERELWSNYGFYDLKVYFEKKQSPISKKVNLQKWPRIDFLSNRTRVMAGLRFLRFKGVFGRKQSPSGLIRE